MGFEHSNPPFQNLLQIVLEHAGEGGGNSFEKVAETEYEVSTTSTTEASVGTFSIPNFDRNLFYIVEVVDEEGKRSGYFYETIVFFIWDSFASRKLTYNITTSSTGNISISASTNSYGVYAKSIDNSGIVTISKRYNSNSSLTIDSTYKVNVYKVTLPDGMNPNIESD